MTATQGEGSLTSRMLSRGGVADIMFISVATPVADSVRERVISRAGAILTCGQAAVMVLASDFGLQSDAPLEATEAAYRRLMEDLGIESDGEHGVGDDWYALRVIHQQGAPVAYGPLMHADFDWASLAFDGSVPPTSDVVESVAQLLLQYRALEDAIDVARTTLAAPDPADVSEVQNRKRTLQRTRKSLVVALVSLDPRVDCYEGFEFQFIAKMRETWGMGDLEVIATSAVDACGDLLSDSESLLAEEERRLSLQSQSRARFVLLLISVASSMTAILTIVDFGAANDPIQAGDGIRLVLALGLVAVSVVLGMMAHRKGLE